MKQKNKVYNFKQSPKVSLKFELLKIMGIDKDNREVSIIYNDSEIVIKKLNTNIQKPNKISFSVSGKEESRSLSARVSLKRKELEKLGVNENNLDVDVIYEKDKIVIKKSKNQVKIISKVKISEFLTENENKLDFLKVYIIDNNIVFNIDSEEKEILNLTNILNDYLSKKYSKKTFVDLIYLKIKEKI